MHTYLYTIIIPKIDIIMQLFAHKAICVCLIGYFSLHIKNEIIKVVFKLNKMYTLLLFSTD